MTRRLYLHVGTHKTGTTSVQAVLTHQAADLRARGVEPALDARGRANLAGLAHLFIRPGLRTPRRLQDPAGAAWGPGELAAWRQGVRGSACATHLISTEAFCFLRTPAEAAALCTELGGVFDEIRPILVLRQEAAWRQSWLAQLQRMGLSERIAAEPEASRITAAWYFDREAIRSFWEGIGPTACIDYDAEMAAQGTILPAVLRAAGLADLQPACGWWLNPSEGGPTRPAGRTTKRMAQ
ncbi:hypothetical protein [Ruixingdingia sedimenti]|uniref:Sulfotransferase family protein n=1 Tax=Ruixingdingia sedimenti TaxID=3073604 RepID=A0ABU1FC34_9RHOB|nr:hypothetical protein [Xinfangfangia sp. LG-4]MDR5654430.1 hypothetical protein [Xinfangfangia sp. LG-4]